MADTPYQWTDFEGTEICVRCDQPGPEEEFTRAGYCPLCAKDAPSLERDARGWWKKKKLLHFIITDPGDEQEPIKNQES